MREKVLPCFLGLALGAATFVAEAFTTGSVHANGVYKFTFGVSETQDGSIPVPASAVCDVNGTYTDTFSYGFLGTTDESYKTDVPSNLPSVPHAIDGFKVVKGQQIVLKNATVANGVVSCVTGPAASEYLPAGASSFEGRYPIRFAARMPERGYYAVTCTVANASSTANADVTLFSERCHTHAQHLTLAPGDTKTFAWSVELAPNVFKNQGTYTDNAINVVVVGENAALASVTVTKQPTTNENATVNGTEQESINVGKTMWLCDDSTGTDQRCDTPYFALQNYAGTGSGLSRWAPADLSIRNQGEGGLNSSDNAHFDSCLLKPGDYLYVQYGHNEGGTESFTNNLEKYLTRANNAGAYLIIVSPIERHYSWDSANNQWSRTLQGYAEAGKAWVEAKIANGATNVAFLDLNERYSTWMNQEIVRINGINSAISLEKAIDFYYMSAKGGSVDKAHPNNAGADVGAYCVWQEALAVVAAGENAEEGTSAKIQADVVSGIINGVAAKVASDTPWYVDDATIAAGRAPNALWDYAVRAGYDYINSAAVAAVDATVSEGVATISGISMRVMNQINYAKAVIDIVSEDETTTNRWYSYCNYDASGSTSGDIVVPEAVGFLSADLDKDVATTSSLEYSATLTIPDGAKAYIHFAEADGGTWQVGENPAISAVYPFEAWTQVLFDDDCSDVATWTSLFGGVKTFASDDGHITFSMTGYDDAGTRKKAGGFAKAFADSASVSTGRIRVSFKTLYTQGILKFAFSNTDGTTTSPMEGGDICATLNGSAAVFGSAANVTLSADSTTASQSTINADEWMDVDMIIDLDAGKATASFGGADYATFSIGTPSKTPWSYFGVTLESTKAHAGAIDDVKIVALTPSPKHLVEAAVNNAKYGYVEINGSEVTSLNAVEGADVVLKAVSADAELYKFVEWQDAEGNTVSTKQTLVIEAIAADCAYTAVFREYAHDENRVVTWDFSEYALSEIAATGNQTVDCNGMSIFLQKGDTITGEGIYWADVTFNKDSSVGSASGRHIEWTPAASGTATIVFQVGSIDTSKKQKPYLRVVEGDADMAPYTYYATAGDMVANADQTLTFNVTAGTLYKIYSFYYNRNSSVSIKSVAYSYAPTYITAAAAVNNANYGSAVVDGAAAAEVFSGREVTFMATPASSAYTFVNWTDSEGTEVSNEATFTVPVSADVAYTANFEKVAAGDAVELSYDFAPFAGNNAVTESGSQKVTAYGPFEIYTSDSKRGNDSITENGIYWHVPSNDIYSRNYNADQPCDYVHNIKLTAPADGTVRIVFKTDTVVSKRELSLCVSTGELSDATWNKKITNVQPAIANTDYTLAQEVTEGTTYWFWCASQNWDAGNAPTATTISSITYSRASDLTTLTVANSDSTAGAVTVNGAAITEAIDVQKGEYIHLVATPSGANAFAGWKNGDGEMVSAAADCWLCVEDATSLTATWRSVDAHSFTWNWNVSEGDWNDPANWYYEGVVPATTYPSDAEADYATFTTPATVTLTDAAAVKEAWFNANVTLTGGTLTTTLAATYENSGKVTLSNAGFANPKNLAATNSCPIVMAADTINWFNKVADGDWKEFMVVSGNISGSGRYNVNIANVQGNAIHFTGNNNEFYGDVYTSGGKSNRSVIRWGDDSVGTNTFLHIGHSYGTYNSDDYRMGAAVKFGGVDGGWWDRYDGALLTIGYLNRDSTINISNGVDNPYRANSVKKVGTANLTLGTTRIKNLTIEGGSVTMPVGIAPQTLTIATGTKIYLAGDAAWMAGTVTNLFSYTTLAGAGTLAEQVEVTGLAEGLVATIAVAENTVTATIEAAEVAPTTDDENATITKNGDGSYTVEVTAETVALTVPDGVTVREVVVSPNTATVTGVPENATVKVAVSWTDAQDVSQSAAYAIVKVDSETGAVSLDEDAIVTVGEEEIALKPQLSDAGDDVSPLEVGEGVAVGIKSIPGLVYRLARGTTPDGIDTAAAKAVAQETATSSRVSLVDDELPSNVSFYRVTVDLK